MKRREGGHEEEGGWSCRVGRVVLLRRESGHVEE